MTLIDPKMASDFSKQPHPFSRIGYWCEDCHNIMTLEKHALHSKDHTTRRIVWEFKESVSV